MKRLIAMLAGGVLVLVGVIAGMTIESATAQDARLRTPAGPWEVVHGRAQLGGGAGDQGFYAIRFNRETGEAWVLSAVRQADDDKWYRLPEVNKEQEN